jgi:hypothetical protein
MALSLVKHGRSYGCTAGPGRKNCGHVCVTVAGLDHFVTAADLDPAAHQDDHLLPLERWPEGLFGLLGRHFYDPKAQKSSG